jgi:hypothetical protein
MLSEIERRAEAAHVTSRRATADPHLVTDRERVIAENEPGFRPAWDATARALTNRRASPRSA